MFFMYRSPFSNKITNKEVWFASAFDYDEKWTVYDLSGNKSNKFGILMDR